MKCDLHVHTYFSEDSTAVFDKYCDTALENGIDCICFTEHVDYNPYDTGYGFYRAHDYFDELSRTKEKYMDRVKILFGIEFSEPHMYPRELEKLKKLPYDFIIGSLHYWYENMFPSVMIKNGISLEVCYEYYWSEMLKMAQCGGFDALGHMDFPKRYYGELLYDEAQISEIFSALIKNNIVPEINTSSLRKGLDTTMPNYHFMEIYKNLGGKYYTTGSDAHFEFDLYADIEKTKNDMKKIGLADVYFEKRCMITDKG